MVVHAGGACLTSVPWGWWQEGEKFKVVILGYKAVSGSLGYKVTRLQEILSGKQEREREREFQISYVRFVFLCLFANKKKFLILK